jgi:uncharacterized surface protein with fasciclin (FAS1) repeats
MMLSKLSRTIPALLLATVVSSQLVVPFIHEESPLMTTQSSAFSSLLISDVIGRNQRIGIFSSLARDVDTVSSRLESSSLNTTLLSPENAAMQRLPRKPWEDPEDYERLGTEAYAGNDGQNRAQENLKRFVQAHVVPASPWKEGEKVKTLAGSEVWWEIKDGKQYVQPGNVEVSEVADKVANGEVWVLSGVLNYAR